MSKLAQQLGGQTQAKVFKKGGPVHDDVAMDKKLIKTEMAKGGCNCGGKVKKGGKK